MKRIPRNLQHLTLGLLTAALAVWLYAQRLPAAKTPEGSYVRVVKALTDQHPERLFPYLENEAQWAVHTVRKMRIEGCDRIRASYPEPQRSALLATYRAEAESSDAATLFVHMAEAQGWLTSLRQDLSPVAQVDVVGDRATVVTQHGTRYAFRRTAYGTWGLMLWTATLEAESERATRDFDLLEAAARDYDRMKMP